MATQSIVPAIVAALLAADPVTDLVNDRICAEGGVLKDETPNYLTVDDTDNEEEQDLEGPTGDCFAEVTVTAISANRDDCNAIAHAVAAVLRDLAGPFAGVTIVDG